MPDARLQRTREAYQRKSVIGPYDRLGLINPMPLPCPHRAAVDWGLGWKCIACSVPMVKTVHGLTPIDAALAVLP